MGNAERLPPVSLTSAGRKLSSLIAVANPRSMMPLAINSRRQRSISGVLRRATVCQSLGAVLKNNSQRAEQSFGTIVTSDAPGEPPSPSPSIHSASNPGCSAVGVYCFERFALAWHLATIRLGVFSSEVSMDWNRVAGNWKQAQGKVKQKWGKLTDDDLIQINGQREHPVTYPRPRNCALTGRSPESASAHPDFQDCVSRH